MLTQPREKKVKFSFWDGEMAWEKKLIILRDSKRVLSSSEKWAAERGGQDVYWGGGGGKNSKGAAHLNKKFLGERLFHTRRGGFRSREDFAGTREK